MENLSGIKSLYFSDKPIQVEDKCTLTCENSNVDWAKPITMSFDAKVEVPALTRYKLMYGEYLDVWHSIRMQQWYRISM